jgi:hypothetical protein
MTHSFPPNSPPSPSNFQFHPTTSFTFTYTRNNSRTFKKENLPYNTLSAYSRRKKGNATRIRVVVVQRNVVEFRPTTRTRNALNSHKHTRIKCTTHPSFIRFDAIWMQLSRKEEMVRVSLPRRKVRFVKEIHGIGRKRESPEYFLDPTFLYYMEIKIARIYRDKGYTTRISYNKEKPVLFSQ